jgi:hypothetical protein
MQFIENFTESRMKVEKKLIMLLFMVCNSIYSQDTSIEHLNDLVINFTKKLTEQKIDTICVYEEYSTGGSLLVSLEDAEIDEPICDSKGTYIPTYILWKQFGKTYITKLDNCFNFSTMTIDGEKLWYEVFKNKSLIKKERVKSFEYVVQENGKKVTYTKAEVHSNFKNFKLILGQEIIEQRFNSYQLQEKDNDYEAEINHNVNYEYNNSLKSKDLIDLLHKIVLKIESGKELKRMLRQ